MEISNLSLKELSDSCRLCLNQKRDVIIPISASTDLQTLIDSFLNIKIYEDGPHKICIKCESMLRLISDFRKEVESVNHKLEDYFVNRCQKLQIDKQLTHETVPVVGDSKQENENLEEFNLQIINYIEPDDNDFDPDDTIEQESLSGYQIILIQDDTTVSENHDNNSQVLTNIDNSYNDNSDLHQNKRKRVRNKTSTCKICGKRVEGPSKLQRHMRVHQDVPRKPRSKRSKSFQEQVIYVCTVCDKQFFSQIRLTKHMESHLPKEMRPKCHSCDKCGNQYLDAASLRVHISLKHSENVPSYDCSICGKTFTRKNYRDYHERQHNSEKKFCCDYCDFKTVKRHNLKRHIQYFHVL